MFKNVNADISANAFKPNQNATYGVEFMEDNVNECRTRLAGPNPTPEILQIVEKNIVHHDALTYDYLFGENE